MNNNSETVIKELLKWLARNGGKYPRPGLRPTLGEIPYALKDALAAVRDSIPTDTLESLSRLAEIRNFLLPNTDAAQLNRAVGKAEEIEWVLACFGEHPYGGLPLADGTPFAAGAGHETGLTPEIGGGYPGGAGRTPPL